MRVLNIAGDKLPFKGFAHRVSSPEERRRGKRVKDAVRKPISLARTMVRRIRSPKGKTRERVRGTLLQTEALWRAMHSHHPLELPESPHPIGTLHALETGGFDHLVPKKRMPALAGLKKEAAGLRREIREFAESLGIEPLLEGAAWKGN